VVVAVEQWLQFRDEEGWYVDVACGAAGLGRTEVELAVDFVQRTDLGAHDDEPSSRWVLARARLASSPHRIPVYAAVITSSWSLGRAMRAAISLTWPALACGRSAARWVSTRTPWHGLWGGAPVCHRLAHQQVGSAAPGWNHDAHARARPTTASAYAKTLRSGLSGEIHKDADCLNTGIPGGTFIARRSNADPAL
jgi:hypothetical protein